MSIGLALQHHIPSSARRRYSRWLYVGEDPAVDVPGLPRVEAGERLMEAAERLRAPYLEWIGRLSEANAGPEWWATHLAAKHPYPSLFTRLCALAAAQELVADGTLVVASTPVLMAQLRAAFPGAHAEGAGVARVLAAAPSTGIRLAWPALRALGSRTPRPARHMIERAAAGRAIAERLPGHRRQVLGELGAPTLRDFGGPRTALLVTWVDARSFDADGRYTDPHLGPLGALLRDRGYEVAYLPKPLLGSEFRTTSRRLLETGETVAFPDLYVTDADWRRCEDTARRYRPTLATGDRVGGVPVDDLAAEYLDEHRRAQADALSHEALVDGLRAAGVTPEVVVFPWEGHAWETVLTAAVRDQLPDTRVVGYDNLNFSRFALSLYPASNEIGVRPLPHTIVTNGRAFAERLVTEGLPREIVRVGGALRHHAPPERPAAPRAPGRPFRVLAAGSIDPAQTAELTAKAWAAFGHRAGYALSVQLHPAMDRRRYEALIGGLEGLSVEDRPLTESLSRTDLLLYTYSSVGFEALRAAVPPAFVRSEASLDLDQLELFGDVRWVARTPEDLVRVADEIATSDAGQRERWAHRAQQALDAAFAPVTATTADAFVAG